MDKAPSKYFYDLSRIKTIPIVEVCRRFGVPFEIKGGKYWCNLRGERTASVLLHDEMYGRWPNSFHDFGTHRSGDVIDLIAVYTGVQRRDAIAMVAEMFNIEPANPRAGLSSYELTLWEYSKIGLYGDLATKNFSFDLDRQSLDRIRELSEKYAMPMNDLRKKYAKIYTQILRDKAIPFVRELRSSYYFELCREHHLLEKMGLGHMFLEDSAQERFQTEYIKDLSEAERILDRACQGTEITARKPVEYDPVKDFQKLQSGELKPTVSQYDYGDMKRAAKDANTSVRYRTFELDSYLLNTKELDGFMHSAYLKECKVVIGYLESDRERIKPLFDRMKSGLNPGLDQKINDAKGRFAAAAAGKGWNKTSAHHREERQ